MNTNKMLHKRMRGLAILAIFLVMESLLFFNAGVSTVQGDSNVAINKPYTSSVAASSSYPDTGGTELTNGLYDATATYTNAAWQGRLVSSSYYQTIDLGANYNVNKIFTNFLSGCCGISWPTTVAFSYSANGSSFTSLGNAVPQAANGKLKKYQWAGTSITARYIRMTVTNANKWTFEDEMEVWAGGTGPTPTRTPTSVPGTATIWKGSFAQPWLISDWTASNFDTEYQYMLNVKMDHNIWQWTVDSTPSMKCAYYPTSLSGFTQCNSTDAVLISLQRAQAKGIKVWLGLNWTDDWWNKEANDPVWLTTEFNLSKQVAQELWNRYSAYSSAIAGFYMTMEVDNVNFPDSTTENRMIVVYNDVATYIHTNMNKPVMVAPFFNESMGRNASDYAAQWGRIVAGAPLDVVALQDGIGVGHATVSSIASWLSPMRTAIKNARPSTQFWVDLETFRNSNPADVTRVIQQLEAEKAYVDKVTTFSFNHYDSPQQGNQAQYDVWKAYTDTH